VPEDSFDDSAHLSFKDVAMDRLESPHLKESKTNSFRLGVDIVVDKVKGPLCPVEPMLGYLAVTGALAPYLSSGTTNC